jgi:hypothetical protein
MPELTMDDFAVGMQVVCIKDHPDRNIAIKTGDTGVVVVIQPRNNTKPIGVQWDKPCGGHDLRGRCESGRGWWCPIDYVAPMNLIGIDDDIDEADFASLDELYGG